MKLKLELSGQAGASSDVVITVEPHVTVGDIATALGERDPAPEQVQHFAGATLALHVKGSVRAIPSELSLLEAGIRSGSTVEIVGGGSGASARRTGPAAAKVRVLSGPDAGTEFDVPVGTSYVGRDASCEVRLSDTMVSKRHAKLHVTSVPEMVDTNSSNGILVDGEPVARIVLRPDDVAVLGETELAVSMLRAESSTDEAHGTAIPLVRPPRINPAFTGREFESPDLPSPMESTRLPIIPMVLPIFLGVGLYFLTKNILSIGFIAMSPLMLGGNYFEGKRTKRRSHEQDLATFRQQLIRIQDGMSSSLEEERMTRLRENPSSAEIAAAIDGLRPLTWCRRTSEGSFLEVRLGLGTASSRSSLKLPDNMKHGGEGIEEILALATRFAEVSGVPIVADLKSSGCLGIAGDGEGARDLARGVVTQVVGLHSPAEVVVAAIATPQTSHNWDWLKWTPHVGSPNSPLQHPHLAVGRGACLSLVAEIEELIEERSSGEATRNQADVHIVLLVENDAAIDRYRLVQVAERGSAYGVSVIWCAASTEQLPAACRTYMAVDQNDASVTAVYVDRATTVRLSEVERMDLSSCLRIARRLSPLVDVGAGVDDDSDLPESVSWLTMAGLEFAQSPQAVLDRWHESSSVIDRSPGATRRRVKDAGIRAMIGRSAVDALHLDLRSHGPHALVGGTTGAGKSELLQSWILSMAANYSPDRLTFLLVDYKGGSAFGECSHLPHTVGMVTDLSLHLARRALTSLIAELRFREHILNRKRAKDLLELEKSGDPDSPPSLIIVIDEFAALVQELPEFIDGVVNVAQRGRSLGLHLILATQRPTGVIKDNLRANTNLRIALRMADEADSNDVLGSPIAASFDPRLPGRASAKLGPGRLVNFQAAYVGGQTTDTPPPPTITVEDLVFGPSRSWEDRAGPPVDPVVTSEVSDVERVVQTMKAASELGAIVAPRLPWLSELAPIYELSKLPTARKDSEIVIGVQDDPNSQSQPVAVFYPDRDGNMVVYGTGGSGKSAALRTIAVSAGLSVRGGPCFVYGLDFGSRGLDLLGELPHVGAVVNGNDSELVLRLLKTLRDEADRRAQRYAAVKAGTIAEYRNLAEEPDEPRIILLVDHVGAFRQSYEGTDRAKWFDTFVSLAQEGRPLGIHVVVSADRLAALPSALSSSMQKRLLLRLASESDMAILGVPSGGIEPNSPPGRGFYDDLETQIAVLGGSANVAEQGSSISRLGAAMRRNNVKEAPSIDRLREIVRLEELPTEVSGLPVIGIAEDTLAPVVIEPHGTFVISGPPGCGRTTALDTVASAVRRWKPESTLVFFGQQGSAVSDLITWSASALGAQAVSEMASQVMEDIRDGKFKNELLVVIIDGLSDFLNTPADLPLQELAKAITTHRHFLVTEGEPSALSGSWPLLQQAKISRRGIALQPEQVEGPPVFKTVFPRVNRAEFPVGRGFLVKAGKTEVVQIGLPD